METLLKGNADEINSSLLEFIRSAFKGKKVAVHIYEDNEMDETEFLLSNPANKKRLLESLEEVKHGEHLQEFTLDELRLMVANNE